MVAAIIEPSRAMGGRHPFPGPRRERGGLVTSSSSRGKQSLTVDTLATTNDTIGQRRPERRGRQDMTL